MKNLIKAINLGDAEVLTLEKAADRMEFEALPLMAFQAEACTGTNCECNSSNCACKVAQNCALNWF